MRCVYRYLKNGNHELCGASASFMLNGNSLCYQHALETHGTGRPVGLYNTPE